jgi:signal transduction histidine kinase
LILRITGPILLLASISSAADEPRRVLLLDSFEKEFAGFVDVFKDNFRGALRDQFPEPLAFYELSVEPVRLAGDRDEHSFLTYLRSTFKDQKLDLIVTIGGPATRFAQKNRAQLFASTPLLFAAVDERLRDNSVTRNTTTVAVRNDPPRMIETILQVLPETKNIVVVVGRSAHEQFWREELGREFQRFENQLTFTWFDNLSFAEMLNRSATLPPNSAIFYLLLSVDAKGIAYRQDSVLSELHAKANAPIFGIQGGQLGEGIVGGPLMSTEDLSRQTAATALRLLKGEAPESIKVPPLIPGPAVFDWRELRRWNINEDRLPPGSIIRFRSPTAWDEYKWYVIAGGVLSLFEFMLVVGLAINVVKRKRVERALREAEKLARRLSGQLIQAQEAERSRVSRELHDDITQRLACLIFEIELFEIEQAEALQGRSAMNVRLSKLREEIVRLCEDVRSLAYNIHPSQLEFLGLAKALKAESEKFSRQAGVAVDAKFQSIPDKLPAQAALCLYRVAQEALRNVSRHSKAKAVAIHLTAEKGGIQLVITDDGVGFDSSRRHPEASLGLASMRERVQLLGGKVEIQSKSGYGTTISAWTPLIQEGTPHLTVRPNC